VSQTGSLNRQRPLNLI